ncbi:MAG: serine hydrolase domain-containing protein [Chitinophagales bacterium]
MKNLQPKYHHFWIAYFLSLFLYSCNTNRSGSIAPKVDQKEPKDFSKQLDSLDRDLASIQTENKLPGFAVAIFDKDKIFYQKGFGYADLAAQKPYTPESVQIIASVTKTLIGVSLMKAVEAGLLSLDDEINDYLPFKVINPQFPDDPITIRHLASHTSSIADTKKSDKGYRFESPLKKEDFAEAYHPILALYNKTEKISMADFLQYKLGDTGKWYEKEVFTANRPGTTYKYSNLGATLLAYIVELVTKVPFYEYTTQYIFKPLNMSASTWNLKKVNPQKHVTYYNELLNEVPKYHIITYPDGGLYSSVADLTKYLQEMIKGYNGESELLTKDSFREMMSKQSKVVDLPDGICWDLSFSCCIGHAGNDFGTNTLMYFEPESGIGRILFTNISLEKEELEEAFFEIFNTLFKYQFK